MFPQSVGVFIHKAEVMSDRSYSTVKTLLQESFSKVQQSMCWCMWLWRSMPLHFHVCKEKRSAGSASTPVSWAPLHIDLNGMWWKVNPALPNGPLRTTICPSSCSCAHYWPPVCNSLVKALLPALQCRGLQGFCWAGGSHRECARSDMLLSVGWSVKMYGWLCVWLGHIHLT